MFPIPRFPLPAFCFKFDFVMQYVSGPVEVLGPHIVSKPRCGDPGFQQGGGGSWCKVLRRYTFAQTHMTPGYPLYPPIRPIEIIQMHYKALKCLPEHNCTLVDGPLDRLEYITLPPPKFNVATMLRFVHDCISGTEILKFI